MNSRTLTVLGVLTVVVAILAFWSLRGRGGTEAPKDAGGQGSLASSVFLPGFADKADGVASITIKGSGKEVVVKKSGAEWVLGNKGNYPVEFSKVRDAVQSLSDLLIFEPKTKDPAKFIDLGLDESGKAPADKPESSPRVVTLNDAQGTALAAVIVGSSAGSFGSGPGASTSYSVFVRRAGENQAYMAKGRLDPRAALDPDPVAWLKKDVLSLDTPRMKSVTITHADGARVAIGKDKKDDRDYAVTGIPTGRELKHGGIAAPIAGALSYLTFDDVSPVAEVADGGAPTGSAEFKTFDGLVVTADTFTKNGTAWATFAARFEAPPEPEPVPSDQTPPPLAGKPEAEVRTEAQDLNERLSKWAFALPSTKIKQILTTMEELLKPADQTPVKIDQGAAPGQKPVEKPAGDPVPTPEK